MTGEHPELSGWDAFADKRAQDLLQSRDRSYEDLCLQVLGTLSRHISASAHVLDVGCGVGALTRKIADEGYTVVGVDVAPRSVAIAQATFGADCVVGGPHAAYEHHGRQLFGGAVANMVLHCVSEPQKFFREVSGVLEPGSPLLFTVPDAMWVANHRSALLPVGNMEDESFTHHEVVRQFGAGGNEYVDSGVNYFLYDSPVAYLQYANPYFRPIEHVPIATPLDRGTYEMGETERLSSLGDTVATLPDIDLFVMQKL